MKYPIGGLCKAATFAAIGAAVLGAPLAAHAQQSAPATPSPIPSPAAPTTPPTYTLRYKFTVGHTRRTLLTMDMIGTMDMMGTSQPLDQHMVETIDTTVVSVRPSDGAATLSSTITDVKMTVNGKDFPLPEKQLQQLERPTTILQTPLGKNLSINYSNPNPGNLPGFDLNSLGDFGSLGGLPTAPIAAGGSWRGVAIVPMLANASLAMRSTLGSVDVENGANIARIDGVYYGSTPAGGGKNFMNTPLTLSVLITGTGTEDFDIDDGYGLGGASTIDMKMTMASKKPPAQGSAPMGPIRMNFVVTTVTKVTDGVAAPATGNGSPTT